MNAGDVSAVSVRPVRRADLFEIVRIENVSVPQPWSLSAFERFLDEEGFLVAVDDRGDRPTVLGYVVANTIQQHRSPIGHVKDIAVHPEHRGRGIGRRLLWDGLRSLRAQGSSIVKLEVRRSNEVARKMYREAGFVHKETSPRYYDNGEDALVMVLDLDAVGNNL
jgi:ribosomal-protein-alanine N-acetyltransferase